MRFYAFINCYLSSIQQGIQAGHILGEIVQKYKFDSHPRALMIDDFLRLHKTFITCNAGNNYGVFDFINLFERPENPYPWAFFKEDQQSLGGLITGVGIILPEKIYNAVYNVDSNPDEDGPAVIRTYDYVPDDEFAKATTYHEDSYMFELIKKVKGASLAR